MKWIIDPYRSVGAVPFGATSEEVEEVLGEPLTTRKTFLHDIEEIRPGVHVVYSGATGVVVEVSLFPPQVPVLKGVELFSAPHRLFEVLGSREAFHKGGLLVIPDLGLSMGGFHNGEMALSLTAFTSGRFDRVLPKFDRFWPN